MRSEGNERYTKYGGWDWTSQRKGKILKTENKSQKKQTNKQIKTKTKTKQNKTKTIIKPNQKRIPFEFRDSQGKNNQTKNIEKESCWLLSRSLYPGLS